MGTTPSLRLVEKTVEVLDCLAEQGELTAAQLAQLTGEPRSSLYRLLASLERLDLVEFGTSRGSFRLGMHLMRLGIAAQEALNVRSRAMPILTRLRDETGLTAYIVVRRGSEAVCIERVEGRGVASLALRVGGALPLHVGAAPRALLAAEPDEAWDEYMEGIDWQRLTPRTPSDPAKLRRLLKRGREDGYSVSDGDVTVGIAAVGSPIRDHTGEVIAALSVSGLRDMVLGNKARRLPRQVMDGAAEISRAMGYTGVP